jgi:hypothetical protein
VAVTDFIHDEEIGQAVVEHLDQHLPEEWTSGTNPILRSKHFRFGDLRDQRLDPGQTWRDICPALLVRLNRSDSAPEYGGLGGKEGQIVPLRILHVRTREQCPDPDNEDALLPPARARARYAKVISKALFANRDLSNPTLTTSDTSARIVEVRPRAIVYESEKADMELAARYGLVALGIDIDVVVRTQ